VIEIESSNTRGAKDLLDRSRFGYSREFEFKRSQGPIGQVEAREFE
jgi:hypothetical protein